MNRTLPKPAAKRRHAQPKAPPDPKPKNHSPRSPLKDLNGGVFGTTTSSCGTSTSTTSIEAPRGCLRLFISNSSSSSSSKAPPHRPKPNSNKLKISTNKPALQSCKPPDERRIIGDGCGTSRLCRWQSGKKSSSHKPKKEVLSAFCSDSGSGRLEDRPGEKKERVQVRGWDGESVKEFQFTPVGCKIGSGCDVECGSDTALGLQSDTNGRGNTPPVEASVSPEIQCGSSLMSTATPVCFGAGHVISGVSDKRKCRPRGLLVIGENCLGIDGLRISDSYDNLDGNGDVDSGLMLVPPLPAEASMRWLLSPCDEEDDQDGKGELRASFLLNSPLSCSSGIGTSSNVAKDKTANILSSATALKETGLKSSLVSPGGKVLFQSLLGSPSSVSPDGKGFISWFDDEVPPGLKGRTSPSSVDTLDSKNLMQTPESNTSSEIHMRLPWNSGDDVEHAVESNLVCAADGPKGTCSSEGQVLPFEQIDSSFEFDSLLRPSSSIDFSQLRHKWGNSSWNSEAIVENALQSPLRISWRDGLSSRIFEIDEFDCCVCLSDEEDRTDRDASDHAFPEPKLPEITSESFMTTFDVKDWACGNRNETSPPHKSIPCAESISMDGGSLSASGDSGWDVCYKNNLFHGAQ
uniref:Uncharacterized protein n=1 Tax=Kalanchoe fedtschenkoi TaxID=63787 RepID=A0A7N0U703_KALFE